MQRLKVKVFLLCLIMGFKVNASCERRSLKNLKNINAIIKEVKNGKKGRTLLLPGKG